MRKVRVEREIPFAKVGEVFEVKLSGDWQYIETGGERPVMQYPVLALMNRGWLSWVEEEKSLTCKFNDADNKHEGYVWSNEGKAKIAREHFIKIFNQRAPSTCECSQCAKVWDMLYEALTNG